MPVAPNDGSLSFEDALAQSSSQPESGDGSLSFEQAQQEVGDTVRTGLRANTRINAGRDPALVAEAERLAVKYGLPTGTAERRIDDLREQETMARMDQFATQAPRTAEYLAGDPDAAAVAKEDIEGLSLLEQAFITAPAFRYVADGAQSLVSGVVSGVGSAISGGGEVLNMGGRNIRRAQDFSAGMGEGFWRIFSDDLGDQYAANYQAMRDILPDWVEDPFGLVGGGIRSVGSAIEGFAQESIAVDESRQNLGTDIASGLGSLGPYLAMAYFTGGAGVLGLGATQGVDTQADRAEAAGTYGTASSDAAQTLGAGVTAVTERMGLGFLMRRLPEPAKAALNKRVADILLAGAGEAGQEVTEAVLQDAITKALVDDSFDMFQGLEREGLAAFGVGMIFRGGVHVARAQQDADMAVQEAETLEQIDKAIGGLKLAELSPERLRDVLARLKNSSISDVYLPVDRFRELFQSDEQLRDSLEPLGVDSAELTSAALSNGQVRVPIEAFFTALTPEQRSAAKKVARLTPGGMPLDEAVNFDREQALRDFIEATGAQGRPADDPTNWIYEFARNQVESAGATPDVAEKQAELFASYFRTAVVRSGMSLDQLAGTPEDPRFTIRRDTPDSVQRVADARNVDAVVDGAIEALRSGRLFSDREVNGQRLIELIRSKGGIDPAAFGAGDLRAQDAQRRGLLRQGGMTVDQALEIAIDNGFIQRTATENAGEYDADGADVNTVIDLLIGDLGETPAFSPEGFSVDRAAFNESTNELGRILEELGIGREQLQTMDNAAVRRALGMDRVADEGGTEFDQAAPTDSEAFKEWFQQSKVANPDGTPTVVYHGTGEEFAAFDRRLLASGTGHASSGLGFYFTPSRRSAEGYADKASNGVPADAVVLEVYLSIQNPYTMTLDEAQGFEDAAEAALTRMMLQSQGFDGVWIPEQNAWVAFEPTQVKSTANRGTWSKKDPRMMFQSVFHGSPHRGIEREGFKLQAIGTGEGAQAYGWGLYFAGKREIAEWYRKGLSHRDMVQKFRDAMPDRADTDEALEWSNSGEAPADMAAVIKALNDDGWLGFDYPSQALNALFGSPENYDISPELKDAAAAMQGQLYAAEIPDDGDLLDWDAPLSEQPEKVRAALEGVFPVEGFSNPTGQTIYLALAKAISSARDAGRPAAFWNWGENLLEIPVGRGDPRKVASEFLLSRGIPGLRYLDGTSRGVGDGSRNYVIWDEGAISDVRTFYQSQPAEQTQPGSSAANPLPASEADFAPVGAWVEQDVPDNRGRPVAQVREILISEIVAPELDGDGNVGPEKRSFVQGYAERLAAGEQAPNLYAVEMEDGRIRLVDGHRRLVAAREAGRDTVRVLVSPLVDLPGEGKVTLTRELARQQPADQTQTPEFKRWSEGAPLVQRADADRHGYKTGEPVVVRALHGTPDGRFMESDGIFKGQREKFGMPTDGSDRAFWFSTSDSTAKTYADPKRAFDYQNAEPAIIDGFVKMMNPLVIDGGGKDWRSAQQRGRSTDVINQARQGGHDGVIITNVRDDYNNTARTKATTTYVVFSSNQIKSATNNDGSFDLEDPSTLSQTLDDTKRGSINIVPGYPGGFDRYIITLGNKADKSTFLHESAHMFLELRRQVNAQVAAIPEADRTADQQRIVDDDARLLAHLGVDSFDAIQREQHEAFAETFEAYLREGKAPSPRLKRAFQSFREWLTRIYRTIARLPNANLTPEVRAYFDRMLATDEEIDAVRQDLGMIPLLSEAEKGDMSDDEFRRYQLAVQAARQSAIEQEGAVQFAYAKREVERAKSAEMKELRAQVEKDLNDDPAWRAIFILRRGTMPDGSPLPEGERAFKLDTRALTDMQGKEWVKKNMTGMHTKEGGVHPDMAASVLGFKSTVEMLNAIASKPSKKDAIEAEALRRWQERNPDPMLDGELEARVTRALHSDAAEEVMVREINALVGGRKLALAPLKEYVGRLVSEKSVKALAPHRHKQVEMRENRKAAIALGKGDKLAAAQARRNALMASLHYRAETDAKERAEAFRDEGMRLAKKPAQERLARAGWEGYLDKVNQILAAFDLRRMSVKDLERKKSLRSWVEAQQEAGEITAISEELLARVEAERVTNWREAKVAEIDAAMDALKNIQHLAKIKNKLTAARDGREWDEARTDLLARMQDSLPETVGGEVSRRDVGDLEAARRGVVGALANLNRPENVIEALDGGETGPWHDYVWTVMQDAENKAVEYRKELGTKLKALRAETPEAFKTLQDKVTILGGKLTVSRATLIGIALNTGNASNLQRLMDGGIVDGSRRVKLNTGEVKQILSELRADELQFVQGMWDAVDSLWPDIVNLQRRMSGLPPEKVSPQEASVVSKDGKNVTLRGGYWPLVYDANRSTVGETQDGADAMRVMMGAGFTKAFTPKGYQKARVESFESPLQLDFASVMSRHMDHVITDLSHREAVRDINRILSDNEIKEQLILRVGREGYDNLRGSLSYAVSASSAVAGRVAARWARGLDTLLTNTSVAALAIRPDIALGNLTSATIQGLDRVGVKALMRGWWALETGRTKTTEAIVAKSGFMAQRLNETDFQFQQELERLAGQRGWGPAYRRMMMALHRAADAEVTRALWWGRYQQALDAGESEAQAVLMADKAVRQTQTASGRKDVSTFERDSQFKQARQFMGPMFVIFGRLYAMARGEGATQRVGARASTLLIQVFLAPAIFALAAGRGPEDGDDDEEIGAGDWARWLAVNVGLFPVMTLPYLRDLTAIGEAAITDKPVNPRAAPTTQAVIQMGRAFQSLGDNVGTYMETGDVDYLDATRDMFSILGPIVGAPASQVRITTRTVESVLDDPEMEKTDLARIAVYGPPPKHQ